MFLRATLNRILALPDLAGLSGTYSSKRLKVEEENSGYERAERKRNKTTAASSNEPQLLHPGLTPSCTSVSFPSDTPEDDGLLEHIQLSKFMPSVPRLKGNRNRSITKSTSDGLHDPPEDDELSDHSQFMSSVPRSNISRAFGRGVSSLPPSSEQIPSSDIVGTIATGTNMDFEDQYWDDSGLDLEGSPSPQGACKQSPIPSIPQDNYGDEIAAFNGSTQRRPLFADNNLYEHEDPWHTIGVILGLSPVRPDDSMLDGASQEQEFARVFQSLSENEDENWSLNGDILSDVQNSDKSTTQRDSRYFLATEDELDVDLDGDPISGSRCASQGNSPSLFVIREDFQEQAHGTPTKTMDINLEALPHMNSPPGPVRTPTPVWKSQSPFRILLESKRQSTSSVNKCSLSSSGSLAPPRSSSSRSQSSLAPRTPSPRGAQETRSPFRMLMAARNRDQKENLNLTDYPLGDSGPSSSPTSNCTLLKVIDGVFQGPCLFSEDAYDASDED
ncbi:hypothetical protein C0992_006817 [Termitomyces sp. T32_za158]|nr:hypothetical protein C0992_006817 [Termitomyces sp. T32_za158]